MMHFMIDLENTGTSGFAGVEYLNENDDVTIFYSEKAKRIETGTLKRLIGTGCRIHTCRLWAQGKNGLDFYIASHAGKIFGQGYGGIVAVVSEDKGYMALHDYWKHADEAGHNLVFESTILRCLCISKEDSDRCFRARHEHDLMDIESIFPWQDAACGAPDPDFCSPQQLELEQLKLRKREVIREMSLLREKHDADGEARMRAEQSKLDRKINQIQKSLLPPSPNPILPPDTADKDAMPENPGQERPRESAGKNGSDENGSSGAASDRKEAGKRRSAG